MHTDSLAAPIANNRMWAGRIITAFVAVFLLFDTAVKLLTLPIAIEPTVRLGYPESLVAAIGAIELVCLAAYLFPPTSVLGAILLTGYLGGATATHVRIGDPFFFPLVIGGLAWAGLYLREERLRGLIPLRETGNTAAAGRRKQ